MRISNLHDLMRVRNYHFLTQTTKLQQLWWFDEKLINSLFDWPGWCSSSPWCWWLAPGTSPWCCGGGILTSLRLLQLRHGTSWQPPQPRLQGGEDMSPTQLSWLRMDTLERVTHFRDKILLRVSHSCITDDKMFIPRCQYSQTSCLCENSSVFFLIRFSRQQWLALVRINLILEVQQSNIFGKVLLLQCLVSKWLLALISGHQQVWSEWRVAPSCSPHTLLHPPLSPQYPDQPCSPVPTPGHCDQSWAELTQNLDQPADTAHPSLTPLAPPGAPMFVSWPRYNVSCPRITSQPTIAHSPAQHSQYFDSHFILKSETFSQQLSNRHTPLNICWLWLKPAGSYVRGCQV